jgi:hypothetical protein
MVDVLPNSTGHLLYEPSYIIPCASNLMEEKSCVTRTVHNTDNDASSFPQWIEYTNTREFVSYKFL